VYSGVKTMIEANLYQLLGSLCCRRNAFDLFGSYSRRLLNENMCARLQCGTAQFRQLVMGDSNDNDVGSKVEKMGRR
jgi:hypothetical protein